MEAYNKYDIASKVAFVENYLALCNEGKNISVKKYCLENNLPRTTFYDWLAKYKNNEFNNNGDDDVSITSYTKPTFIELTKDKIAPVPINDISNFNGIKLSYKDLTLEFNDNQLDRVMEIIRRW